MRHTAFLAQSGAGKSYALGVLLEEFIAGTSARIVVFDPNSDFSKIWTAANDCPDKTWFDNDYFPHASDIPIVSNAHEEAYKQTADKLISGKLQGAIFDLGLLSPPQWPKIVSDVLGAIWKARESKIPTIILIDEAHNFVPQNPRDETKALTELLITIAGEGRKYGLWLVMATQRPQKLHENVLSQCDNLIVMKLTSRSDISYIVNAYNAASQEMIETARNFKLGEALALGRIVRSPTLFKFRKRRSAEGGSDLSKDWAKPVPKDKAR